MKRILVLTQFNSTPLHRHIQATYQLDPFDGGFVEILSAEQTDRRSGSDWYLGRADAVRKHLHHLARHRHDLVLILSSDQLYRIDFRAVVQQHVRTGAELTILATPFSENTGTSRIRTDENLRVREFSTPNLRWDVDERRGAEADARRLPRSGGHGTDLSSTRTYLFNRETLDRALRGELNHFGMEVIPSLLDSTKIYAWPFDGYWRDIISVRSYFEANLAMTEDEPEFSLLPTEYPVFSRPQFLPPSKIARCRLKQVLLTDGCILNDCTVLRSVIGPRSRIQAGSSLKNVVLTGANRFESERDIRRNRSRGVPDIGIGEGCRIADAIIDRNARIGAGVVLSPETARCFPDPEVCLRDGIVVVSENAVLLQSKQVAASA